MDFLEWLDSWPERATGAGAAGIAVQLARWWWRRRGGRATRTSRIFLWVAQQIEARRLIWLLSLRLEMSETRNDVLEAAMRAAGLPIPPRPDGSAASSIDLPESGLVRLKPPSAPPSATTEPPRGDPLG